MAFKKVWRSIIVSFFCGFFNGDLIDNGLKKCFRVYMMFNILIWYIDDLEGVINVSNVNSNLKQLECGLEFWVLGIRRIYRN